jgi:hypothetical protein
MSTSLDEGSASLSPNRVEERIREIVAQDFYFQVRLWRNGEGNWLDIELAEQMLTVYIENPLAGHINNILVICDFLLHWRPELVRRFLRSCRSTEPFGELLPYAIDIGGNKNYDTLLLLRSVDKIFI